MRYEVDICWPIIKCKSARDAYSGEFLGNTKLSDFIEVDKITEIEDDE